MTIFSISEKMLFIELSDFERSYSIVGTGSKINPLINYIFFSGSGEKGVNRREERDIFTVAVDDLLCLCLFCHKNRGLKAK